MALSGRVETSRWTASNGSWYRTVVFEWSATQDISGNYSIINWTIKGGGSNNNYYVYAHEIEVLIDGGREFYKSDINTKCYYNTVLASGSTKLNHNSDGSRTFSVTIKAGLYTYSSNKTGSDSFTLDAIALASKISSVSTSGLNALSTGFTNTFNRITSTVNQGTNRVVASVNQMNNRVSSSYNNFASQFISRTTTMWNQFNSMSQQAMNRQYSTFNSHLNKMTSKYNSYNSRFKNVTNSTWRSVVNQVRQAGNNMTSAYSNACSRTISLANNLRSNLISIMNSTAGGMRSAGYNAGMGFYYGLSSTQGAIMGLASSIAASVSARIRSALNIHSPSRVMMDLGSYAGEGLAVGLDKSRKYVNNAVDGLSNTVANTKIGFGSSYGSFSTSNQAQPLVLNVSVGKNEFRAISRDITSEQGRDLRLEANFAL